MITDFGAFVNILPNKDGLIHISQIAHERVSDVNEYLTVGQEVDVKVLDIDKQNRIKLSMKALVEAPEAPAEGEQNAEATSVEAQEAPCACATAEEAQASAPCACAEEAETSCACADDAPVAD